MGDQELRSTEQWYKVHPPEPEVHWGGATRDELEWQRLIGQDRYNDQQDEDAYRDMNIHNQTVHKDVGKPPLELLSPTALLEIAKVLEYGKGKYALHGWRGGFEWSRIAGSVLRHTFAWLDGEDIDSESGLQHLAHAGCDIMFLLEWAKSHPEFDDRYMGGKQ